MENACLFDYQLINAYPNRFNSIITISLHNFGNSFVQLDIINAKGQIAGKIYSGYLSNQSSYTFLWDAHIHNSGIYFARVATYKKLFTHKIIHLK